MMRQQFYTVANHSFSLEMAESSPLWRQLQNYGPFLSGPDENKIFCLRATPEAFPIQDFQLIYHAEHPAPGDLVMNVFLKDKRYLIEYSSYQEGEPTGRLLVDFEKREALLAFTDKPSLQTLFLNNALMTCFMLFTLDKNTLLAHASVVTYQGKAYLFLGKSGTGKSTHSRLWLENIEGTTLLNDDNPVVRLTDKGIAMVYGTPWSGKTPCYRNEAVLLGGIIRIRRALENQARRLDPVEAYASLLTSCSRMPGDKRLDSERHATLSALIAHVPCWVMNCLPNPAAAKACANAVRIN